MYATVSPLDELLWAVSGLLLTIGGMFLPASIAGPGMPLSIENLPTSLESIPVYPLQVTYQIGAVLLVGCMAGKQAATLSQIAYLILGLVFNFQIFAEGGGWDYLSKPSFGYLLGFIPAAWLCGTYAFRQLPRLENLGLSGLIGLTAIHTTGLFYLGILAIFQALPQGWLQAVWQYSLVPLPGQLVMICVVAVIARLLRLVLLY